MRIRNAAIPTSSTKGHYFKEYVVNFAGLYLPVSLWCLETNAERRRKKGGYNSCVVEKKMVCILLQSVYCTVSSYVFYLADTVQEVKTAADLKEASSF